METLTYFGIFVKLVGFVSYFVLSYLGYINCNPNLLNANLILTGVLAIIILGNVIIFAGHWKTSVAFYICLFIMLGFAVCLYLVVNLKGFVDCSSDKKIDMFEIIFIVIFTIFTYLTFAILFMNGMD